MNKTNRTPWLITLCGILMAAALTITGCATSSARDDLDQGKALIAAGRVREAHAVLTRAHVTHPGNKEIDDALYAARTRFAGVLLTQGNAAMNESRWNDAETSFKELGSLNGYENTSAERLAALRKARSGAPLDVSTPARTTPVATPLPVAASSSSASAPAASQPQATTPAAPVVPAKPAPAASAPVAPYPAVTTGATPAASAPVAAPVAKPALSPFDEALNRKVTLQFRDAPVKSLFDAVGKTSGLNIVIDKDVQADLRTSIFLRDTTVRNALDKIVLTTRLAWRPMDENTLIIYPDEQPKQNDYQGLTVRGFHLANADAKFVANSMKTILKFRDVVVDEKLNMIVVRDTPQALSLAEQLIALHDVPEPEVMLEVAILEVNKGKLQNLGVAWPTGATLTPLGRTLSTATSTSTSSASTGSTTTTSSAVPLTVRDLYNLTPGSTLLNIGGVTLNAGATDSDVNILGSPRIRAKNKEKAKILIGERVPNISATATSNGVVSQNITYVDVGLKLEVEPQILPGNEINLKLALEVSSINSTVENAANGTVAYRIGTRTASTVLRLRDGENQVLGGLIQDTDRKTVTKVPLLGDIPILGHLFRSDSSDKGKTEVVLSITPRLVRGINKPAADQESFDAGTVTSVRGRRNDADQPSPVQNDSPQPQPVAQPDQQPQTRRVRDRED